MFLRGEFIKRNFEYTSHDSDWLIDNWDCPIKLKNFPIDYAILFLGDLISYYHHMQHKLAYQSILADQNEKEYLDIIKDNPEWIKKFMKYLLNMVYPLLNWYIHTLWNIFWKRILPMKNCLSQLS